MCMLQGAEAGDGPETEAFYSPLRSGASQISFKSDSPGSRSHHHPLIRSASGPLVPDENGTPRSPWAITHDQVFQTLDVGESDSPLRHGARHSPLLHGAAQRSPGSPGPYSSGHGSWAHPAAPTAASPQTQRLPRRAMQSGRAGARERDPGDRSPAARSQLGSPAHRRVQQAAASPGVAHRYPPDADAESPMASPGRQQRSPPCTARVARAGVQDCGDLDTDGAEATRPVAARSAAVRSNTSTLAKLV